MGVYEIGHGNRFLTIMTKPRRGVDVMHFNMDVFVFSRITVSCALRIMEPSEANGRRMKHIRTAKQIGKCIYINSRINRPGRRVDYLGAACGPRAATIVSGATGSATGYRENRKRSVELLRTETRRFWPCDRSANTDNSRRASDENFPSSRRVSYDFIANRPQKLTTVKNKKKCHHR